MQNNKDTGKSHPDNIEMKSDPKMDKDYKKKEIDPHNPIAVEEPLQNDVDDLDPKTEPKPNPNPNTPVGKEKIK